MLAVSHILTLDANLEGGKVRLFHKPLMYKSTNSPKTLSPLSPVNKTHTDVFDRVLIHYINSTNTI